MLGEVEEVDGEEAVVVVAVVAVVVDEAEGQVVEEVEVDEEGEYTLSVWDCYSSKILSFIQVFVYNTNLFGSIEFRFMLKRWSRQW